MNNHLALSNLGASEIWTKGNITVDNYDTNVKCENKPSWSDFIAEKDRLDALEVANQYQVDRANEYPPLEEQLDYIYHNGIEAWKTDIIQPIKEAHPKP